MANKRNPEKELFEYLSFMNDACHPHESLLEAYDDDIYAYMSRLINNLRERLSTEDITFESFEKFLNYWRDLPKNSIARRELEQKILAIFEKTISHWERATDLFYYLGFASSRTWLESTIQNQIDKVVSMITDIETIKNYYLEWIDDVYLVKILGRQWMKLALPEIEKNHDPSELRFFRAYTTSGSKERILIEKRINEVLEEDKHKKHYL
jgi:hypothetical protein